MSTFHVVFWRELMTSTASVDGENLARERCCRPSVSETRGFRACIPSVRYPPRSGISKGRAKGGLTIGGSRSRPKNSLSQLIPSASVNRSRILFSTSCVNRIMLVLCLKAVPSACVAPFFDTLLTLNKIPAR